MCMLPQKHIDERPSPTKKYNIRVLVPCYNEDDLIIKNTVAVAAKAEVPPGDSALKATGHCT